MKIAILGWGSLIWDTDTEKGKEFDRWCYGEWAIAKGLELPLEFSRVSESRNNALTLVIDENHGTRCCVFYVMSKRKTLHDAICDLRCREGTVYKNIGHWPTDSDTPKCEDTQTLIGEWADKSSIDAVVWTALENNFTQKNKAKQKRFTVENAIQHVRKLTPAEKAEAVEYVSRAPDEIRTKLREKLETEPWFWDLIPKAD